MGHPSFDDPGGYEGTKDGAIGSGGTVMSLRRAVGHGLVWVSFATLASRGLSLLRQLILARLLVPADFGLVAYASLAIGIFELFREMGLSSALIYRKDDIEEAANTTFLAVLGSGALLYGVAWLLAPLLASFFHNEALVAVLRTLSITLAISAISQVPITLMAKGMGFKNKVIPEVIAGSLGSAASVAFALLGHGVWSIVYGQLITASLTSILVWFFCPWRPSLQFSVRVIKEMWDYGKHIIGSQIMVFFITNIDDAFVGRFLGDAALGTYSLAFDLSNLPATHLSRIVGQVMFPAFSRVQDDLSRLREAFFQSMKYVSLAAFPIAVITCVFARDFIVVAYGSKWYQAVLPLQLMTVYGLARAIAINMGNVFKAGGKPKWLLYIAAARLVVMAALLYPAVDIYEIDGVAGLSAIVSVLDFALSVWLANRILQASWKRYVQIFVPMAVTSIGTALLGHQLYLWTSGYVHPFVGLPLSGGLALLSYLALMCLYDPQIRVTGMQALTGVLRMFKRWRVSQQTQV
jgi:O-antigen/teichoic acid export membrane protein